MVSDEHRESGRKEISTRELVILLLSLLLLIILAIDLISSLDNEVRLVLYWFDTVICMGLLCDFFIGLYRAASKARFLKSNWLDFVSSIPLIPVLRVGRIFRVLRLLRLLRAAYSSHRIMRHLLNNRKSTTFAATVVLLILVALISSASILEFENSADSNIRSAGDALWWSFTTMTTVGYGDKFPMSTGGRIVALFPMICGIGVFALITSLVSAWFLKPGEDEQSTELALVLERLAAIERRLDQLSR